MIVRAGRSPLGRVFGLGRQYSVLDEPEHAFAQLASVWRGSGKLVYDHERLLNKTDRLIGPHCRFSVRAASTPDSYEVCRELGVLPGGRFRRHPARG